MEIVTTKLIVPSPPDTLVKRRRALAKLRPTRQTRLVLLSAPAGAGKTTLLAEWLQQQSQAIAWLSLEPSESHLEPFLLYLVSALGRADATLDAGLAAQLRSQGAPEAEPFMTVILNRLTERPGPLLVVLDDYHVVTNPRVHVATEFLLEHLPPHVCLVIASRSDPPFALGRLRARNQLLELRSGALRFTVQETEALLNGSYNLELSDASLEQLEARTEGWAAGLQLAALSLAERPDKDAYVSRFVGSHRHLTDYLFSEVFALQPPELQVFLQRTAALDRFTVPLCEALVGRPVPADALRRLEAKNLFMVALDEAGGWYRYHHLFAEFLRQQLEKNEAAELPALYDRASRWFEARGLTDEAISYVFRARDLPRAAELIEKTAFTLGIYWENAQLIRYVQKLPLALLSTFPKLCIYYAWALSNTGQLDILAAVVPILEQSEACSDEPHTVRACALTMRAYEHLRRFDVAASAALCTAALEELGTAHGTLSDEARWLLVAATNLMAYGLLQSDLSRAAALYPEAIRLSKRYGNLIGELNGWARLGRVQYELGRPDDAHATLERGLGELERSTTEPGRSVNAGELQLNLALLHYEWDQLAQAETCLEQAKARNQLARFPPVYALETKLAVQLAVTRGAFDVAEAQLNAFSRWGEAINPDNLLHTTIFETTAVELRLRLIGAPGNTLTNVQRASLLKNVVRWAERYRGDAPDPLPYYLEARYALLAQVRLQQNQQLEALALLNKLVALAEHAGRTTDLVRYLILRARAQPEPLAAQHDVRRALGLAEPFGYRRCFLDYGSALLPLLAKLEQRQPSRYLTSLTTALRTTNSGTGSFSLNRQQRAVLHHLSLGCSNKEIAKNLGLSLNTVKWYLREIYSALGAKSRVEAVNLVRERQLDG